MYDYIQISKINDYVFCPHSLYFHSVYEGFDNMSYKAGPQIAGTIAHESIDVKKYSTRKNILQGLEVFSEQHGIIGKIDIYDKNTKELIERKRTVSKVYDGYVFQLYAQKLCLEEMGYEVVSMSIQSLTDNKNYNIIPDQSMLDNFFQVLSNIKEFNPLVATKNVTQAKCDNCIYHELCKKI
jgi:CRISPR-associated exonuclease Cas4